jgi:hypothetical protein
MEFATGIKGSYILTRTDDTYWELTKHKFNDIIVEPFMISRFGSEKLKFQMGFNFPMPVGGDQFATPEWSITLGMMFRIGKNK